LVYICFVSEMAEKGAVASGSFVAGGFQMKGSSKRRKITTDGGAEIEARETVLGIEKGIIKSASLSLSEASSQLIIPLPPPRIVAPKKQKTVVEIDREKISDQPISLEQQAADELVAEMTGTSKKAAVNLLSIPVVSSDPSGQRKETYGRSAPLLAASLAPELIGLRDDDERFKADINTRPEDLGVRSDAYKVVRIEDFGAAMLRGKEIRMGRGEYEKPA
jgi:hypothetical protein